MKDSCACCSWKNPLALTLGLFAAVVHFIWLILVATNVAKPMMDWVLQMHHIQFDYTVMPINYVDGLILVVLTFVVGYVLGTILAGFWCLFGGCSCKK